MTNKEIAKQFSLLAKLMELHGENTFKAKTYLNAYNNLRRLPEVLSEMSSEDRLALPAVGKSVGAKIEELLTNGSMVALESLIDKTPSGIIDIIQIRGLGAKKVKLLWQDLGIESATELLYACQENRLIEIKGFGAKSQKDIAERVRYFLASRDKYLYAQVEQVIGELLDELDIIENGSFYLVGEAARMCPVIDEIRILYIGHNDLAQLLEADVFEFSESQAETIRIRYQDKLTCSFIQDNNEPAETYMKETLGDELYIHHESEIVGSEIKQIEELVMALGLDEVPIECWDWPIEQINQISDLIDEEDLKGVVHAHSTYSDGANTLKDMALAAQKGGFEYFVITDHSKAAFYASGLTEDEILVQAEEVDKLNASFTDFKVLKGIECDILSDGSMDYTPEILEAFDVVIASIHSNLKMTEEKAMARLLAAIENPNTHILGHLTSRLLLAREGYPVDHRKIIDACAAHGMAIELNANPYRLDIDYRWLEYAQDRGVMISINPDAHSIQGIDDIRYGVLAARKGGLRKENCLNALSAEGFMTAIGKTA